jgi:hypothetical protein
VSAGEALFATPRQRHTAAGADLRTVIAVLMHR